MTDNHWTLGVNPGPHDGAAALLKDGSPVVFIEQERCSRNKFAVMEPPIEAVENCLVQAGIDFKDIDCIGLPNDDERFIDWLGLTGDERREFPRISAISRLFPENRFGPVNASVHIFNHHMAHAASAIRAAGFEQAAVLVMDDRGEDTSITYWNGSSTNLEELKRFSVIESLGLFYRSAATYAGFDGEFGGAGKFMGLASYGKPTFKLPLRMDKGNLKFDGIQVDDTLHRDDLLQRIDEAYITWFEQNCFPFMRNIAAEPMAYRDFAASVQLCLEKTILGLCTELHSLTNQDKLGLAGGVALNCTANGYLSRQGPFKEIWIQPAAGDAGTALGGAYLAFEKQINKKVPSVQTRMSTPYIGSNSMGDDLEKELANWPVAS